MQAARPGALALTLGIATLGGGIATILGLPVGWLLGSTFAVAAASLGGLDTRLPALLRDITFVILGIQAGSGVTPEVVDQFALWPASFAIQMAGVVLVVVATYAFLRTAFGWDKETALFASLPGALSFVLAAASETRADMTRITVVQSVRLLLLIGALTPVLAFLEGGGETVVPAVRAHAGTALQYVTLVVACLGAAALGHLSRLPGGLLLGALVASAVLHASGIAPVSVPQALAIPALVILGVLIGGRLKREDRWAMMELLPASLGAFAIGLALSGAAAFLAYALLGIGFGKIALAYAPGALEALTVLSFQFDQDPAYVAAHHVVRFMAIALIVPLLARRLAKSSGAETKKAGARPASSDGRSED
ncbi:MAG: AbrB family transcriptional regulator [Rhizobiaceae bacterium]|nr:AbrB family transcriptional regulator [Rhizobiaceae bacterium]